MSFDDGTRALLDRPLDAARVKQRDGSNGRSLSYIETHDAIRTANEIFGYGEWGHDVVELRNIGSATVTNRSGQAGYQTGYLCVVRLAVRGCAPVCGVGYGDAVEYRESGPVTAHELAAKEAESDALKRALKNYGDQFGLALYSKSAAEDGHLEYTNGPAAAQQQARSVSDGSTWTWPFGKHKGATIADTPAEYLAWFLEKSDKDDIKDRIRASQTAPVGGQSEVAA